MVKQMGEVEELLALAARADDLVAERAGRVTAGQKALDRAFSLLERDQPTAAIRELHKAKAKRFSGEQFRGTLGILLLLAEQYCILGLVYAAKYHAMAAAFIARYEDRKRTGDLQSKALLELLDAENAAGNSLGFLQLFSVFLAVHIQHDDRPLDAERHPSLSENMGHLSALLGFLKRGNSQARKVVDELFAVWPAVIKDPIWKAAAN